MKRLISSVVFLLLIVGNSYSQSRPAWTVKLPKAVNNTYIYVCETAVGGTEKDSRNQAIARVFQTTAMRLGVPFDSQKVFDAVQRGTDINVISREYNIPIYKVCEYTERVGYNYKVYVLCQVAAAGNIMPQFDYSFRGCNDDGRYSMGTALLSSALLPGLGQMGKRHYGEGVLTLLGELALVGGGVTTHFLGKSELEKLTLGTLSYDDYMATKTRYNQLRTANGIFLGAAAVLYIFNIYRAAALHPNYKQTFYVEASTINMSNDLIPSMSLTLKF